MNTDETQIKKAGRQDDRIGQHSSVHAVHVFPSGERAPQTSSPFRSVFHLVFRQELNAKTPRRRGKKNSLRLCASAPLRYLGLPSSQRDAPTIARRFNAGSLPALARVPQGRQKTSVVPAGLETICEFDPALKCRAILTASLRDFSVPICVSSVPICG